MNGHATSSGSPSAASGDTVNGIDMQVLGGTVKAIEEDPALAKCHFRARNVWLGGNHNRTTITGFYGAGQEIEHTQTFELDADEPAVLAGEDLGPNPVEHLLNSLVTCLTTSMVAHAAVRGIRIDELESEIEGDIDLRGYLGLSADVPRGYTDIRVKFRVEADERNAERLKRLAEFSPVFNTITQGARVNRRSRTEVESRVGRDARGADPTGKDDVVTSGSLHRLSAFASDPGGGNPAGVWIGPSLPASEEMLTIAARVGFSETAFVAPDHGARKDGSLLQPGSGGVLLRSRDDRHGGRPGRGRGRWRLSTEDGRGRRSRHRSDSWRDPRGLPDLGRARRRAPRRRHWSARGSPLWDGGRAIWILPSDRPEPTRERGTWCWR